MLTIVIGFVLTVLCVFIAAQMNSEGAEKFFIGIGVCISLLAIVVGFLTSLSGYKDWQLVQETELVSLSNGTASGGTGFIYVSLSADSTYTYRYEVDSEFGTETSKEYETRTLTSGNVQEVEDPNCKVPVIREYYRKGKSSIWTFALCTGQCKYVFYVPEGTISKDVTLK